MSASRLFGSIIARVWYRDFSGTICFPRSSPAHVDLTPIHTEASVRPYRLISGMESLEILAREKFLEQMESEAGA